MAAFTRESTNLPVPSMVLRQTLPVKPSQTMTSKRSPRTSVPSAFPANPQLPLARASW